MISSKECVSLILPTFILIFFLYFTFQTINDPYLKTSKKLSLHGNFLHITDFHPDPHYIANSTLKSKCHGGRIKHKKRPKLSGTWGSSATKCDTPMSLINATFNWLEENWKDKLDFIIWTEEVYELNRMIATKFLETFSNSKGIPRTTRTKTRFIPIVPSIGNNDIHPNNILLPGPNNVLSTLHSIWEPFIPESQRKTFLYGGYFYTEVIPKKLMVISLNTIYFYNTNTAVNGCKSPEQPGTIEMKWLRDLLKKARKLGMKVYLTGHVAPRKKQYVKSCYINYKKLSIKYHDLILGHYYGHSNMDHFFFMGANKDLSKFRNESSSLTNYSDDDYDDDYYDDDYYSEDYDYYSEDSMDINSDDSIDNDSMDVNSDDSFTENNSTENNSVEVTSKSPVKKINKYLRKLYNHYRSVPPLTKGVGKEYVVIHINPSVIPVFYPALRIFKYNTTEKNKQPKGRDPNAPSHINTFLTPLGYTQYFINLTHSNLFPNNKPEYTIEYTTWDDYQMKDLTVPSWINLARQVTGRKLKSMLWSKIEDNLMVGARDVLENNNDRFQDGISKGPEDYLISDLDF
ncbi:31885_t:CDS:2 [Gigaspora margarita]|uniref:31885_t:CDS:1 n=1 Tax=Gigaspora margarita TaxID=4874 RepID=A0ABN7V802_GIGMA|nr:31885_t:CDS:2 [Gigaspora margarita]